MFAAPNLMALMKPYERMCEDSLEMADRSPYCYWVINKSLSGIIIIIIITLRAKLSGAVYCNQSCLCVCVCLCVGLFVCLWVCYHDNSKLRESIFTKLGL